MVTRIHTPEHLARRFYLTDPAHAELLLRMASLGQSVGRLMQRALHSPCRDCFDRDVAGQALSQMLLRLLVPLRVLPHTVRRRAECVHGCVWRRLQDQFRRRRGKGHGRG